MRATTYIPRPVKRAILWAYLHLVALSCRLAGDGVRLSLGGVLPPPGKFIRGGKVKLVHLRNKWGDRRWGFNILYLVSSTMPSNPDLWVRILKRAGVHIIWNQNGVAYPAWAGDSEKIARINTPMHLLREANLVVYQSEFCKESADQHVTTAAGRWVVIPNSVDTADFAPASRPVEGPLTLLVMGSHFTPEKVLIPLQALALLRRSDMKVRMLLAGRFEWPDAQEQIRNEITRLGLTEAVQIHGSYLQREAPALYRSGHIFIHMKYMDPCPTAVIEAMACGLPVIGSDSGGMRELVGQDAGILLSVKKDWDRMHYPTAEAVVTAVRTVASDLKHWSTMARERALARFDSVQWIERHKQIFHEIIDL